MEVELRRGILRWDDGDFFEGEFLNDEKVRGTFKWKNGENLLFGPLSFLFLLFLFIYIFNQLIN